MSAEDKVLKLLKETNKPYHVQGVADMLAAQGVKKTQAEKALDALAEQGKIVRKEFGKTKIYYPSQEGLAELTPEEKQEKLDLIKSLGEEIKQYDESVAALKKELAASNAALTVEQLQAKFAELQEQSEALNIKLAVHRSGAGPQISSKDVETAEAKLRKMLDTWEKRRRIFRNVWMEISENIDAKQSQLFDDIGIETDDAVGESSEAYRKLLTANKKAKK